MLNPYIALPGGRVRVSSFFPSNDVVMSSSELHEKTFADVKSAHDLVSTATSDVRHIALGRTQVDTAAELVAGKDVELDAEEARRIRRKIDWHLMPMMCSKPSVKV